MRGSVEDYVSESINEGAEESLSDSGVLHVAYIIIALLLLVDGIRSP